LGNIFARHGQTDAAIEQFSRAMQVRPDEEISVSLGNALLDKGKPDEAMPYFRLALQMLPDFAKAYNGLGRVYLAKGQTDAALQNLRKAVEIETNLANCYTLGCAYAQSGKPDLAIRYLQMSVELQPDFAPAHNDLGNVYLMRGQAAQAEEQWRAALKTEPDLVAAQVNLAWALATSPEATLRNGAEAVALARRANQETGGREPGVLRVLAAADAENGQFQEAVAAAQGAMEVASLRGNSGLANAIKAELKFYQNRQPYRSN
jgi:predicted Zn-dependent protease